MKQKHKFIAKVRETGFIVKPPRRKWARKVRTPENIEAVAGSVRKHLPSSTLHRS